MQNTNKILLIECCNFIDFPGGGQLSFAKHTMHAFNSELALVGITTEPQEPVGIWFKKTINNVEYDYFSIYFNRKDGRKPLVPMRISNWIGLRNHKKKILSKQFDNVLVQAPEVLLAIIKWKYKNICYRFAGTENPLSISRYKIGKLMAFLFDSYFFPKLSKVNKILAASNRKSIEEVIIRSKGYLTINDVIQFPTRFDSDIFKKKLNRNDLRKELGFDEDNIVVITVGRLGWYKGWKFMIDSFLEFKKSNIKSKFYLIGDGEDRKNIISYIKTVNAENSVFLKGFLSHEAISKYQNASDLFIMGSFKEGWSTALVEAIACGLPATVTNFSSAKEIIQQGINGYVADNYDISLFSSLMTKALSIDKNNLPNSDIKKYALSELKTDLLNQWQLI